MQGFCLFARLVWGGGVVIGWLISLPLPGGGEDTSILIGVFFAKTVEPVAGCGVGIETSRVFASGRCELK